MYYKPFLSLHSGAREAVYAVHVGIAGLHAVCDQGVESRATHTLASVAPIVLPKEMAVRN